ncbi:MAG: class I SAM-dependent methyltransferase, partial [Candidatus Brocadiaceae bacterium]
AFLADARSRAERWQVADRARFVQLDASEYEPDEGPFDVAGCMGATMCFGGFGPTLRRMKSFVGTNGALVVAEAFFTQEDVPEELRDYEGDLHTEPELFDIARGEGLEVGYYARASEDEWCRYIFGSRRSELDEFAAMPAGAGREEHRARRHRWQDMYIRYRQKWQEMGFFTLHPV